ncbi:MAG: RNA methyltransferase [Clostridia bacterium]|nr:RNA methyltransferase [Clostridia bacterium]
MCRYILSSDNITIKKVSRLLISKKYREKEKRFVLEGARLCGDAVDSDVLIDKFLYTEKAQCKYRKIIDKIKAVAKESYLISEKILGYISDTQTPQGLVCVCIHKENLFDLDKIKDLKNLIALENMQDPTNLGTIFRTAEALGIGGVILSDDCCDVFNPKVLRGSMGAIFRIPIYIAKDIKDVLTLLEGKFKTYAAVPDKAAGDIKKADFSSPCLVVIGNEGNGIKEATIKACKEKVMIPMLGRAESLNASVAASIIMWEMVRGGLCERS